MQLKSKFHDPKKYQEAVLANGNLTQLKGIFREWINNFIEDNPNYYYHYSTCETFGHLLGHIMETPDDRMYEDAMELLRECAIEKNIEFDGYFNQRFQEAADTLVNFDDDYFDDPDRTELYVYLAASVDEELYQYLGDLYRILLAVDLTSEMINEKIEFLTKVKKVRF